MSNRGGLLYGDWSGTWPVVDRGEGVFIYDQSGRAFLDAVGGSHVVSIGHGVAEVSEAIANQAQRIAYASSRVWLNQPQVELAELIRARTPQGLDWVYYTSGGSESAEMAIQLARQYYVELGQNERHKIIGRSHSYHGGTLGAVAVGGHVAHRERLEPYLRHWPMRAVASPQCTSCPFGLSYPSCHLKCASDLVAAIEAAGPKTVAAFIAEPIGGTTGGAIEPPPGYYEKVMEICREYGILFIADEVVTGFGRTGINFAIQHWDAIPDIMMCSKGLTSGYAPLGAVVVHERVASAIRDGSGRVALRLTYSGNPVSCMAGLAVQRYVADHDLVNRCATMGEYLKQRLRSTLEATPFVAEVRGRGLLLAVALARDPGSGILFPRSERVQERVVAEGMRQGIMLMGGNGTARSSDGDHILLSPPFVITEDQCDLLVELLQLSVTKALLPC